MDNTKTMKQVYLLAQEHCSLKVGDWVRVTRAAKDYEAGWDNIWLAAKDEMVGIVYKIIGIDEWGIWLNPENKGERLYSFPYFVLEKVEKPAHKFKPFDKVLVRDGDTQKWQCTLFSHYDKNKRYFYRTISTGFEQCIPYEGNEHLVGTTDMPEG